jgi:hypothetical protein
MYDFALFKTDKFLEEGMGSGNGSGGDNLIEDGFNEETRTKSAFNINPY